MRSDCETLKINVANKLHKNSDGSKSNNHKALPLGDDRMKNLLINANQ